MFTRTRLRTIGSDGYSTLLLSNLVLFATGGILLWPMLYRVVREAASISCTPRSQGCRLVLGHVLRQGKPSAQFRARLDRARLLADLAPEARVLVLGGRTASSGPSEAQAGRDYLLSQGVSPERVLIEDSSRHTLENLQNAKPLILGDAPPVLISNRFHLARCRIFAAALGLEVELCAAEPAVPTGPAQWLRMLVEAYLLHWYYVGRQWSRWTSNERSLARIS